MNKINNKCLLTGDKFIPELHLKQKGFTYSTCRPFTKNREKIQKFREISSLKYLYRKYYFAHDAAYSNSKDLAKKKLIKHNQTYPPKFKVNDRVRITKHKIIFSKGYTEHWSREMFIINSVLKNNTWTYRLKDLNEEKIKGNFYEKELLRSKL